MAAAAEYAESLLQKDYYVEGCPGCEVDRLKQLQRGFPLKQILTVWIIVLSTSLTISSLFSFLYFMVVDIIKDDLWPNHLTYFNNEAEEDLEMDDDNDDEVYS